MPVLGLRCFGLWVGVRGWGYRMFPFAFLSGLCFLNRLILQTGRERWYGVCFWERLLIGNGESIQIQPAILEYLPTRSERCAESNSSATERAAAGHCGSYPNECLGFSWDTESSTWYGASSVGDCWRGIR